MGGLVQMGPPIGLEPSPTRSDALYYAAQVVQFQV